MTPPPAQPAGTVFEKHSEASEKALLALRELLISVGFKVHKKPDRESTLRVYPGTGAKYPLLNPRFYPPSRKDAPEWRRGCLEFAVYSKGRGAKLDKLLGKFQDDSLCIFVPDVSTVRGGYRRHGHFQLPLTFAAGKGRSVVDLDRLRDSLWRLREFIDRVG